MRFIHLNLGFRNRGEIVEVTLSAPANVKLMDAANLDRYRQDKPHECLGGAAGTDVFRIRIPRAGGWHLAVDQDGAWPDVKTTVRVVSPRPSAVPNVPLNAVLHARNRLVARDGADDEEAAACDVFIAHVAEDRAAVVKPLTKALETERLIVWSDDFELKRGEDPRHVVERGIACSRLGVLIVSANLFTKKFTQRQLDELALRPAGHAQVMLPVWHSIPKLEIDEHSHLLASAVQRDLATQTAAQIASEIAEFLKPST